MGACASDRVSESDETARAHLALTSNERILGFESTADWGFSEGSGSLAQSSESVEGDGSLALANTGNATVRSAMLSGLGAVGPTLSVDVFYPSPAPNPSWHGTVRVVLSSPSLGLYWLDLGEQSLASATPGEWSRWSFALSPEVRGLLAGSYSDLQVRIQLNVPLASGPWRLDRLSFNGQSPPAGAGGGAGAGGSSSGGAPAGSTGAGGTTDGGANGATAGSGATGGTVSAGATSGQAGASGGSETPSGHQSFSFQIPAGQSLATIVLASSGGDLDLADRVRLAPRGGILPLVSNVGGSRSTFGTDNRIGSVVSSGPVELRNRAFSYGDVTSAQDIVLRAGAGIAGAQTSFSTFPAASLTWSVDFGATSGELGIDPQGATHQLEPGRYSLVTVETPATLQLSTGRYVFDALEVRPDATIVVDDARGPVEVVVRDSVLYHGTIRRATSGAPSLLLLYAGYSPVVLERAFSGTVLAPNTMLALASTSKGHRGSFFAKSLEIRPDVIVHHEPLPSWPSICRSLGFSGPGCGPLGASPPGSGDVFDVALPRGPNGGTVVVSGGSSGITVGAGADVTGDGVVLSGTGGVRLGDGSQVPGVVSTGPVSGGQGVLVDGGVTSGGAIELGDGSAVTGDQLPDAAIDDTGSVRCTQIFGVPSHDDVSLEAGRARVLLPASYRDITVAENAILYLSDGSYHFDSLVVRTGGSVVLESSGGYSIVWVRSHLELSGTVAPIGAIAPKLFVGFAGASPVSVGGSFWGTLYAPNAGIDVTAGVDHRGAIYGKGVTFAPGTGLTEEAAPLRYICGETSTDARPVDLRRAPVRLVASQEHGTGVSHPATGGAATSIDFRIPRRLLVAEGNAGNGQATLSFTTGGSPIACHYRGGAPVAHPMSRRDRAAGLQYRLESCDGGLAGGEVVAGSDFGLEVQGDVQSEHGDATVVEVDLGVVDGMQCSRDLPSFIDPDVAVETFESFSWRGTGHVGEMNSDGTPALYYATIYVKSAEEYELLDRLLIHHQDFPLFQSEYPDDHFGACGNVRPSGDAAGGWVFAVIPGVTYNRIRSLARGDVQAQGDTVMFDAIVLRPVPAGAEGEWVSGTAIPTLSYDVLREVGFRWRLNGVQVEALPDAGALAETSLEFSDVAATFVDAMEFVYDAAAEAVELTLRALAHVDLWLAGSVSVDLDFNLTPQDSRFTGPWLPKGFGPNGGAELAAHGASVDFLQVSSRLYTAGIPITTMYSSRMNERGQVHLDVANADSLGVTWFGGLCMAAHNNTARVADIPGPPAIYCLFPDPSLLGGDHALDFGFDRDTDLEIGFEAMGLQYVAEMGEAREYATSVMGLDPRKAHVLKGLYATALSLSTTAWAPCLRTQFSWMTPQTVSGFFTPRLWTGLAADAAMSEVLETYIALLNSADIVFPLGANSEENHGIATHEYGHFIFCTLVAQKLPSFPVDLQSEFWLQVMWQTVFEGFDVGPNDDARIVNESFADLMLAQIAGGTNYFSTAGSDERFQESGEDKSNNVAFCHQDPEPDRSCLDENLEFHRNVGDDEGDLVMAGLATNIHDAFDGRYMNGDGASSLKLALGPTNSDFFSQVAPPNAFSELEYTTDAYGNDSDESVALPGSAWSALVTEFLERTESVRLPNPSAGFSADVMRSALAATMRYHGASWCDACRVMALHDSGIGPGSSSLDMWRACTAATYRDGLGDPPDAHLSMDEFDCETCGTGTRRVSYCQNPDCRCWDAAAMQWNATDPASAGCALASTTAEGTFWESNCTNPPRAECECTCQGWDVSCRQCPSGRVPVRTGNEGPDQDCVPCPTGSVIEGDECRTCGPRQITHLNLCQSCQPGQSPNSSRTQCIECPMDASVALGEVHCSAIVERPPLSILDPCPDEFWVEVSAPATGDLVVAGAPLDGLPTAECGGSTVTLETVWGSGSAIASSPGESCSDCGNVLCSFAPTVVDAANLTAPVRIRVAGSGSVPEPDLSVAWGEHCELPIP